MALPRVVEPANTTPRPSIRQRFAVATASAGKSGQRVRVTNSTTARVARTGSVISSPWGGDAPGRSPCAPRRRHVRVAEEAQPVPAKNFVNGLVRIALPNKGLCNQWVFRRVEIAEVPAAAAHVETHRDVILSDELDHIVHLLHPLVDRRQ